MAERLPPTPARLRRALGEGDTPLSSFAARIAGFAVFALLAPSLARAARARFDEMLRVAIAAPAHVAISSVVTDTCLLVVPALLAAAATCAVAGVAQTGFAFAARPGPRLLRFWDGLRAYDVLRNVVLGSAVLFAAASALVARLPELARGTGHSAELLDRAGKLSSRIVFSALALAVAFAALDVMIRRAAWIRRQSPTPEEAKREKRETEGDPAARRARRRAHEALTRSD